MNEDFADIDAIINRPDYHKTTKSGRLHLFLILAMQGSTVFQVTVHYWAYKLFLKFSKILCLFFVSKFFVLHSRQAV